LKNLGLQVMWHPALRLYHPWHPHAPGYQEAYRLQKILIRHRAVMRDTLAYQGIDSSRNRPLPFDLEAALESEQRKARFSLSRLLWKTIRR
jgi:hypothetical protein